MAAVINPRDLLQPHSSTRGLEDREAVVLYRSSPYGMRSFTCGSVTTIRDEEQVALCATGDPEGAFQLPAQAHVFVGSEASWHTITDSLAAAPADPLV